MLLIIGIMIGYITSSAISLLNFFSTAEGVHSYMIWGMGNFGGVSLQQLPFFSLVTAAGLLITILLIKPLNALLLGTRYAENLGINIRRTRNLLLVATGLLTATTTAFCGPISFIGLAVPHIARLMLGTSNHNSLLPVTMLTGGAIALLCNFICILPGEAGIIPLNAVTPVIGAPIIIYVIVNQRKNPVLQLMEKQAVITATDLCIGYRTHKGEKKVHEHLSFGLYPGELTSLLGANGAGKSTLLRTLSASQPSLAGDLQLLGKPLQQYSEKERSRTIGVVLTDKTQAGGLTVYELVALGRQPHTGFFLDGSIPKTISLSKRHWMP